jgi:sialic acid synthase SpsE
MTKIIAEIGWNHMGSISLAKKMILAAKKSGADLVKTQIFDIKYLKPGPWMKDGRFEIYKKAQLTEKKYKELLGFSKKNKINFFTSVFNILGAKQVLKVHNELIKIPSTESRNIELIKFCTKNFKKIFISTGTSTKKEILKTKKIVKYRNSVFLHCVSSYPCDAKNANLPRINFIKTLAKESGFSDHTLGTEVSKIALGYKIDYLEKHFTIDKSLPGRDNKFAILPHQLKDLVLFKKILNECNKSLGSDYLKIETETRRKYTGRWG